MSKGCLTFGRKGKTPEGIVSDGCIARIKLLGYLWLESRELKRLTPDQCAQLVKTRGLKGFAWRSNTGGASDDVGNFVTFGLPGWVDITVAQSISERDMMRLIGIELKAGDRQLNPNQERLHALVNAFTTRPSFYTVRHHDELVEILK